eukprot:TRINITY_DN22999_c0_g1_i1.p1 TRINITY_DN22999_c0_g1~~TRINITY_DN22999_c0_g1_i1.p1  ORF type:complete len:420 (-),score=66.88 TRINITY_DN22999_c0_g1_i1:81-1340(-)
MELLQPDLLAKCQALLPLPSLASTAATCRFWKSLSTEAFSDWLRWRQQPEVIALYFPDANAPSSGYLSAPAVGGALVDVRRSGGFIGFAEDKLWVQRVVRQEQAIATSYVALSSVGCFAPPQLRTWPFEVAVGGLPGGIVGHGQEHTAFFPLGDPGFVEVTREYKNILYSEGQVFLLRSTAAADVLNLSTRKKACCNLKPFFKALEAQCVVPICRQAVSATSKHFLMHGSTTDGAKFAAAVRLPDVQFCDDGAQLTPVVSFAKRWPAEHPVAMELSPLECPVGDCLLLHGRKYSEPLCILHAASGEIDILRLREVPDARDGEFVFSQTAMNLQRSLVLGILENREPGPGLLAIWHSSGCLLSKVDLRTAIPSALQPLQLAVHDSLPLVAVDFSEHEDDPVETFLVQFPAVSERSRELTA